VKVSSKLLARTRGNHARGTMMSQWSTDCNRELVTMMCTEMYTSPEYFGHWSWEQSNIISAILKVMLCDIGSQWRLSHSNVLVVSYGSDQSCGSIEFVVMNCVWLQWYFAVVTSWSYHVTPLNVRSAQCLAIRLFHCCPRTEDLWDPTHPSSSFRSSLKTFPSSSYWLT